MVEFANGAALLMRARSLQGLEDATEEEFSKGGFQGETGLHWESRDVDLRISGMIAGIFGTARFMEAARRGGQSRSETKATTARANGAKGARLRKAG